MKYLSNRLTYFLLLIFGATFILYAIIYSGAFRHYGIRLGEGFNPQFENTHNGTMTLIGIIGLLLFFGPLIYLYIRTSNQFKNDSINKHSIKQPWE